MGDAVSRRGLFIGAVAPLVVASCISVQPGVVGWYSTGPGSPYGYDFQTDGIVLARTDDRVARATYSVDGAQVLLCAESLCVELRLDGECLVATNGSGTYCKDPTRTPTP